MHVNTLRPLNFSKTILTWFTWHRNSDCVSMHCVKQILGYCFYTDCKNTLKPDLDVLYDETLKRYILFPA